MSLLKLIMGGTLLLIIGGLLGGAAEEGCEPASRILGLACIVLAVTVIVFIVRGI